MLKSPTLFSFPRHGQVSRLTPARKARSPRSRAGRHLRLRDAARRADQLKPRRPRRDEQERVERYLEIAALVWCFGCSGTSAGGSCELPVVDLPGGWGRWSRRAQDCGERTRGCRRLASPFQALAGGGELPGGNIAYPGRQGVPSLWSRRDGRPARGGLVFELRADVDMQAQLRSPSLGSGRPTDQGDLGNGGVTRQGPFGKGLCSRTGSGVTAGPGWAPAG
jgi:hypothetical protein